VWSNIFQTLEDGKATGATTDQDYFGFWLIHQTNVTAFPKMPNGITIIIVK